jgi:hypothetical protein
MHTLPRILAPRPFCNSLDHVLFDIVTKAEPSPLSFMTAVTKAADHLGYANRAGREELRRELIRRLCRLIRLGEIARFRSRFVRRPVGLLRPVRVLPPLRFPPPDL